MHPYLKFFAGTLSAVSVTVMTALGLIAAILYATALPPTGAIIVCVIIAVLGAIATASQARRRWAELVQEEEIFKIVQADFETFSDDWKRAFKELVLKNNIPGDSMVDPNRFRSTGYVWRDGDSGRFFLLSHYAKSIAKLTKNWKPKSATES